MIVLDASVVVEMLLRTTEGEAIAERVLDGHRTLHAPQLLDVECAQVLRRYVARGELSDERGRQALDFLALFPLTRYVHEPLLGRMWELRENLTAYDAVYVALAEGLQAPLLTRDARLAGAPRLRTTVEFL